MTAELQASRPIALRCLATQTTRSFSLHAHTRLCHSQQAVGCLCSPLKVDNRVFSSIDGTEQYLSITRTNHPPRSASSQCYPRLRRRMSVLTQSTSQQKTAISSSIPSPQPRKQHGFPADSTTARTLSTHKRSHHPSSLKSEQALEWYLRLWLRMPGTSLGGQTY